jgi:hypothetical protein
MEDRQGGNDIGRILSAVSPAALVSGADRVDRCTLSRQIFTLRLVDECATKSKSQR